MQYINNQSEKIMNNADKELEDFFTNLLMNQQPLGDEFEKVLFENLWELCLDGRSDGRSDDLK